MFLTVLLSVIVMAGMVLMLLANVCLSQGNRLFTSAPEEVQKVIQPKKNACPEHMHLDGYFSAIRISIRIFIRRQNPLSGRPCSGSTVKII